MEVDLRSATETELRRLDAFFRRAMREAADDENAKRREGDLELTLKLDLIGERPTGETPADHHRRTGNRNDEDAWVHTASRSVVDRLERSYLAGHTRNYTRSRRHFRLFPHA